MVKGNLRKSFRVDRSMYEYPEGFPRKILGDLGLVVQTDLRYHYSGPICSQRWLDVCEDPEYGHQKLLRRIDEVFPRFLKAIMAAGEPAPSFILTSLGPGDGSVDRCILRHMDELVPVQSYGGFDSSFELLRLAIHRIGMGTEFRQDFPVEVVCGDFTEPGDGVQDGAPVEATKIFSLTGFTLGNFPEKDLLSRIETMMRPQDYLFLDARVHALSTLQPNGNLAAGQQERALASYGNPSVKRFVFGPVEMATHASTDEVDIRLEMTRSLTHVPNAVNMVFFCEGLDTTMRFTGQPVKRDRLNLAVTTLYGFEDLETWLVGLGFRLIASEQRSGMGFFLLQRRDHLDRTVA